jgi:hypothetical protein
MYINKYIMKTIVKYYYLFTQMHINVSIDIQFIQLPFKHASPTLIFYYNLVCVLACSTHSGVIRLFLLLFFNTRLRKFTLFGKSVRWRSAQYSVR